MRRRRRCFSLLEVILALAILSGALGAIGEVSRRILANAHDAQDLSRAQLLCETKMAEICGGLAPPTPVDGAALAQTDDEGRPQWFCSVATEAIDQEGMTAVRVTVSHERPSQGRSLSVSLVRWMFLPPATPEAPATTSPEPKP